MLVTKLRDQIIIEIILIVKLKTNLKLELSKWL